MSDMLSAHMRSAQSKNTHTWSQTSLPRDQFQRVAASLLHKLIPELHPNTCVPQPWISFQLKYINICRMPIELKSAWFWYADLRCEMLETGFTNPPIHDHSSLAKQTHSPTDASHLTIPSIHNQLDGYGFLGLIPVSSERFFPAGQEYNTWNWDLIAIMEIMK